MTKRMSTLDKIRAAKLAALAAGIPAPQIGERYTMVINGKFVTYTVIAVQPTDDGIRMQNDSTGLSYTIDYSGWGTHVLGGLTKVPARN